ncbi:hypothetical protein MP638_003994 [Amoeboaphelidium occidentale]|nr:hypothetical protein MP638_003994 [Amoeboaphelidium occidentale]
MSFDSSSRDYIQFRYVIEPNPLMEGKINVPIFTVCGWTPAQRFAIFPSVIRGTPLQRLLAENALNHDAQLQTMREIYYPAALFQVFYDELHGVKKLRSESIEQYLTRLRLHVKRVDLTLPVGQPVADREILQFFIRGLPMSYRTELIKFNPATINDTIALCKRIHSSEVNIQYAQMSAKNSSNSSSSFKSYKSTAKHNNHNRNSHRNKNFNNNRPSGSQPQGQSKWCRYHKSSSHSSEECNFLKNQTTRQASAVRAFAAAPQSSTNPSYASSTSTRNNKSSVSAILSNVSPTVDHNTYEVNNVQAVTFPSAIIIPVSINGVTLDALVDPGSSVTLIRESDARTIPSLHVQPCSVNIIGAATRTTQITSLAKTVMKFPSFAPDKGVPTNLLISSKLSYSVILGINTLARVNMVIDFTEGCLSLFDTKQPFVSTQEITKQSDEEEDVDLLLDQKSFLVCSSVSEHAITIKNMVYYDYPSIIGSDNRVGCLPREVGEFKINLKPNSPSVNLKPYSISSAHYTKIGNLLKTLQENQIIRPSLSPFSSPAFPILKKNGTIRLVVDYRKLNSITEVPRFPMPNIHFLHSLLSGSVVFTKLDANSGYFQIQNKPETIPLTAFVLPHGQYEFLRMPFGVAGGPATYQSLIQKLFPPHQSFVLAYMDDLLIFSKNLSDHMDHCKIVF